MIKVLFVEDHAVVREGIARVLKRQADMEVVGEAENGAIALQLLNDGLQVDVVLTDMNMPVMNGLELIQQMSSLKLNVPVIILTMHADTAFVENALASGFRGYLLKNGDMDELVACIRDVHAGQLVISKELR